MRIYVVSANLRGFLRKNWLMTEVQSSRGLLYLDFTDSVLDDVFLCSRKFMQSWATVLKCLLFVYFTAPVTQQNYVSSLMLNPCTVFHISIFYYYLYVSINRYTETTRYQHELTIFIWSHLS